MLKGKSKMGWTQEKVAKTIGLTQGAVAQAQKRGDASIIKTNITCMPDLRYKIKPSDKEEITGNAKFGKISKEITNNTKIW